ncbi:nitrous oxide reductase family maturation protein NosD [Psychroserpens sp.]|uniref:nitrous oxide reductase family maturation protein NosD n=1 Tax=Psychroserpens sp. TaxID=2020870 RepID=UPI001AFCDC99|nr:nitrous oxide reductase family maturation protein NosD [Psychroserpens sp.]MBO6607395.1 nitrous oxide reductase family maturation protein NosD [Psychroserpens sp.]MBO6632358.1 nitrous oxide reductase family maturation protein NosD [Psychroserpens sp.]MBO6654527.1 nitrous oxide reductase family maturation protein NosD [Psychroserpens sp.]MBO6681124.1 nitrous oxide reductase family maturation protein NosD [Psychroserpens sp.]MBO6749919.1 nitrous oxide reductase family maturation protein NosD 
MKRTFLIVLLIITTCFASATTITICEAGCDFQSIQTAVDSSKSGDSLFIKAGVYKEANIIIYKKSLHITGEDGTIIDTQNKGYGFSVEATDIIIKNLTLRNIKISYTKEYAGILLFKSYDFVIQNVTVENAFFGFLIQKSKDGEIRNNVISGQGTAEADSGNAIHLWHCENVRIINNDVRRMRDGIYLEFGNSSYIADNYSTENMRYGLHFMFSNDNIYENNIFEANGAGVAVMFSKRIKMFNNLFKRNWGTASYGILLKEINDAELKHNVFEDNTIGINADGTNRISYFENVFKNNGYAIKVHGACYDNIYTRNNFLHNSFDLSYSGKLNSNKFENNYWSNYTGYDLDKDGIGDVPYRPVKLFSYLVNRTPESIVLLRSLFIDIINFSEKVSPVFTPENLIDNKPLMHQASW